MDFRDRLKLTSMFCFFSPPDSVTKKTIKKTYIVIKSHVLLVQGYQNLEYLLLANRFLEAVVTQTIWMTSDLLFGSPSLALIDEPKPYLMIWLGGQNHTSTRPNRDRSDTVGILPAVKHCRMGVWAQILQHEILFQNKTHCKRSHTAKTHSFVPRQRQLQQLSLKFPCKCWIRSFMRSRYTNCMWKELVAPSRAQCWQPSKRVAEACMGKLNKTRMKLNSPRTLLKTATEWSHESDQSGQTGKIILRYTCAHCLQKAPAESHLSLEQHPANFPR